MHPIQPTSQFRHIAKEPKYTELSTHNDLTLLFNRAQDGRKHGPAKAIHSSYCIEFNYIDNRKQGPAIIKYSDGSVELFTYRNDVAEGTAKLILYNKQILYFRYENGVKKEVSQINYC